ncbi:deoxyribose-phosphate aldolase [Halovenus sp. WSH3]|uniref:Deoxyribose-phosphate aldolase n=1 Tax=Halovenus carboxidivorans TaxID=2692199 RepID=A0A6B0T327_9EURY|nr:deoxyribose-phosphate aldolase [Halovenus carboxidivorans]MXR50606.1 deoxyribose-phosphate aldolase [Halovenus carboxidivorans]
MDDIPSRIEHTVLGPETTWEDVRNVLDTAEEYGMRACVPPCYVEEATEYAPETEVATVIGFPHGQHTVSTKCTEATEAWQAGAGEIDIVPNLGHASGDTERFHDEVAEIVAAVPIPVKVILETSLFDEETLETLAREAAAADVDFLKTATGFADGGATVADVELLAEFAPVKASGGVGSWAFASELFDAGAERIGASSGDVIVREYLDQR